MAASQGPHAIPKKVSVSVLKIFGTGKKYRYRYLLAFWVPSHTVYDIIIYIALEF